MPKFYKAEDFEFHSVSRDSIPSISEDVTQRRIRGLCSKLDSLTEADALLSAHEGSVFPNSDVWIYLDWQTH